MLLTNCGSVTLFTTELRFFSCIEAETDGERGVSESATICATFGLHTGPEKKNNKITHLWPYICIAICAHEHGWEFTSVFPLCAQAWLSKQVLVVGMCGSFFNHPTFLFVSPLTVLRLVTAHLAASACSPFQGSWSETINALAALLASSSAHLALQTPMTAQGAHFVSCVCPKIVSICIFGNGNVCIINLFCQGNTKRAIGQKLGGPLSLSLASFLTLHLVFLAPSERSCCSVCCHWVFINLRGSNCLLLTCPDKQRCGSEAWTIRRRAHCSCNGCLTQKSYNLPMSWAFLPWTWSALTDSVHTEQLMCTQTLFASRCIRCQLPVAFCMQVQ